MPNENTETTPSPATPEATPLRVNAPRNAVRAQSNKPLVIALVAMFIIMVAVIGFMMFGNSSEKPAVTAGPTTAESIEIARLRAELEKQKAAPEVAATPEVTAPTTHPKRSVGVKTWDPTTILDGRNTPNLPVVTRVQKIEAPAGTFYLLYGVDPVLNRERMITNGGNTDVLLEPEWKTTRPKGELMLLKNPPPGLKMPPGRLPVAIVVAAKG